MKKVEVYVQVFTLQVQYYCMHLIQFGGGFLQQKFTLSTYRIDCHIQLSDFQPVFQCYMLCNSYKCIIMPLGGGGGTCS